MSVGVCQAVFPSACLWRRGDSLRDVRHVDGRMSPGMHGLSAREWQAQGAALGCLFSSVASLYSTSTISQMDSPAQESIFSVTYCSQWDQLGLLHLFQTSTCHKIHHDSECLHTTIPLLPLSQGVPGKETGISFSKVPLQTPVLSQYTLAFGHLWALDLMKSSIHLRNCYLQCMQSTFLEW